MSSKEVTLTEELDPILAERDPRFMEALVHARAIEPPLEDDGDPAIAVCTTADGEPLGIVLGQWVLPSGILSQSTLTVRQAKAVAYALLTVAHALEAAAAEAGIELEEPEELYALPPML